MDSWDVRVFKPIVAAVAIGRLGLHTNRIHWQLVTIVQLWCAWLLMTWLNCVSKPKSRSLTMVF